MPPQEQAPPAEKKPRRRWKRRLLGIFFILALALYWLNGYGIRWGLDKIIEQQLAAQELSGTYEVEGTLLQGLAIKNLSLSGETQIQKVESDLIELRWNFGTLKNKHLESLTLNKLHLTIDPNAPQPKSWSQKKPKKDTSEKKPLSDTLDLVRNSVISTAISIEDIQVKILDASQTGPTSQNTTLTLQSIKHTPGTETYQINNLTLSSEKIPFSTQQIHNPSSELTWDETHITLDQFTLLPNLSLQNLAFQPEKNASLQLVLDDQQITLKSNLKKHHQLTLDSPTLSLASIGALINTDLVATGNITKLEIDTSKALVNVQGQNLRWQEHHIENLTVNAISEDLLDPISKPINIDITLDTLLKVQGTITPETDPLASTADLTFQANHPEAPPLTGQIKYSNQEAHLIAQTLEHIKLDAHFQVTPQTYTAKLTSTLPDSASIPQLAPYYTGPLNLNLTASGNLKEQTHQAKILTQHHQNGQLNADLTLDEKNYTATITTKLPTTAQILPLAEQLTGPLNFTFTGDGNLESQTHNGTLDLQAFQLKNPSLPHATTTALIKYNWPKTIKVENLQMQSPEGKAIANLNWGNNRLHLTQLDLIEGTDTKLLTATADLPLALTPTTLDELLNSTEPISLDIKSQPLTIKKIASILQIESPADAIIQTNLTLEGTLAKPKLNGFASIDTLRLPSQPDLPPLDLDLNFDTKQNRLDITANAGEPNGPLLNLTGQIPFLPREWIERKTNPSDTPINLHIKSPTLDLVRVKPFVPIIKNINGNLKLDLKIGGTVTTPTYFGTSQVKINRMRLTDSPIADFRDINLNLSFTDQILTINRSTLTASGGTAQISGTVDLNDTPTLDITAKGQHLLLNRTTDYTFRGDPDLRIKGTFDKSTISGTLNISESLIYKDLEILPFGVPRTTDIPQPNLPSFSAKKKKKEKSSDDKPETGILTWDLDIDVNTADPILIRGNLAKGEATASIKVTGTINDPKTAGTITTKDLVADLPFSDLNVQTGVITLRPDHLTNPNINLRGSSKINDYTVDIYLGGPVQNPELTITSDPPLPEAEIMLLLATGSASSELQDRDIASQKALQYLLEGLRRRNKGRDKTLLQRTLKNSEKIQLNLGGTQQYTGRQFTSATLEIDEHWDFTTQIDNQGQARALLIFSVRLR